MWSSRYYAARYYRARYWSASGADTLPTRTGIRVLEHGRLRVVEQAPIRVLEFERLTTREKQR